MTTTAQCQTSSTIQQRVFYFNSLNITEFYLFKDIYELIDWYNNIRPHMSLNLDVLETPSQAYVRKMPKDGIVTDEQSGEIYHAKEE